MEGTCESSFTSLHPTLPPLPPSLPPSLLSMSGNESESALVSQSSLEETETQTIVSLNSSLTRSILMLDIWLSQVHTHTHTQYMWCITCMCIHVHCTCVQYMQYAVHVHVHVHAVQNSFTHISADGLLLTNSLHTTHMYTHRCSSTHRP